MEFRTKVEIKSPKWTIEPQDKLLFVGSCFADNIGQRFVDESFCAMVNPQGVMYNPASIFNCVSTIEGLNADIAVLTLGTNHVYRLKETGEIVANCQKRPQSLFNEEELTIDECADYLQKTIDILRTTCAHIIITVSPIRYAKYGYHESQLSKAILLLAADKAVKANECCEYFPAYEIINDELRDYRFYNPDMLHPSKQAVDFIWEKLGETYFSKETRQFIEEWKPIKAALNHKPFDADSEEYRKFYQQTLEKQRLFLAKYRKQ